MDHENQQNIPYTTKLTYLVLFKSQSNLPTVHIWWTARAFIRFSWKITATGQESHHPIVQIHCSLVVLFLSWIPLSIPSKFQRIEQDNNRFQYCLNLKPKPLHNSKWNVKERKYSGFQKEKDCSVVARVSSKLWQNVPKITNLQRPVVPVAHTKLY